MPAWAKMTRAPTGTPRTSYERANGRLYSEIQFALPRELDAGGRQALAGAFAEQVCGAERLPLYAGDPPGRRGRGRILTRT